MDATSPSAPPPPPESPPGSAPPSPGGVASVAKGAVQLYQNINKVDRWGGGGLTLSTVVKLAGWAGLIVILAVLVMKLREVEEQLDPVASIVTRLMAEVEASRVSIRKHTEETRVELERLAQETDHLKNSVFKTEEAETEAQKHLDEVDRRARALADQLEQETTRVQSLAAQGDTASETLKAYARSLSDLQAQAKTTVDQSSANVKAMGDSLKKVNEQAADLQKALAGLQTANLQASLARADSAAKELAQTIDRASAKAKASDSPSADRKTKAPDGSAGVRGVSGSIPGTSAK